MLTDKIKKNFECENGVSFRELSRKPSLIQKIFSAKSTDVYVSPSIKTKVSFSEKTIDVKTKESECNLNLKKW